MPVYILAIYDIFDATAYEPYVPGVVPLLQKHGAEILVADYEAQMLEGESGSTYVVLRFESEVAALAWYNDPAYEPVEKFDSPRATMGKLFWRSSSFHRIAEDSWQIIAADICPLRWLATASRFVVKYG